MNYGPNREWDKHRESHTPRERHDDHLERRVAPNRLRSLLVSRITLATASTTPSSNGPGMILSVDGSVTSAAIASAAASLCWSVILDMLWSSAPRKMPGNAKELLTWLGKSLRPVAMIAAPAALASSGIISGTGLA